ncbi:BPTD_2524 family lipoprotein [Bordetella sp. 2513F-2]
MHCKKIAAAALVAALAGCAVGNDPGGAGLSGSFEVPTGYQAAYEAAVAQAERCLLGQGGYRVERRLDAAAQAAQVRVVAPFFGGEMARVEIVAQGAGRSRVQLGMWGRSIWDRDAMHAMRQAIVFGVPSCRAYMPGLPETGSDWISG